MGHARGGIVFHQHGVIFHPAQIIKSRNQILDLHTHTGGQDFTVVSFFIIIIQFFDFLHNGIYFFLLFIGFVNTLNIIVQTVIFFHCGLVQFRVFIVRFHLFFELNVGMMVGQITKQRIHFQFH